MSQDHEILTLAKQLLSLSELELVAAERERQAAIKDGQDFEARVSRLREALAGADSDQQRTLLHEFLAATTAEIKQDVARLGRDKIPPEMLASLSELGIEVQ